MFMFLLPTLVRSHRGFGKDLRGSLTMPARGPRLRRSHWAAGDPDAAEQPQVCLLVLTQWPGVGCTLYLD